MKAALSPASRAFLRAVGDVLRAVRRERRLHQAQLGARADIAGSRVGEIERGRIDFGVSRIATLAAGLDITWSALFRRVELATQSSETLERQREQAIALVRRLAPADLDLALGLLRRLVFPRKDPE